MKCRHCGGELELKTLKDGKDYWVCWTCKLRKPADVVTVRERREELEKRQTPRNEKKKLSVCLLISFIIGLIYAVYSIWYWFIDVPGSQVGGTAEQQNSRTAWGGPGYCPSVSAPDMRVFGRHFQRYRASDAKKGICPYRGHPVHSGGRSNAGICAVRPGGGGTVVYRICTNEKTVIYRRKKQAQHVGLLFLFHPSVRRIMTICTGK